MPPSRQLESARLLAIGNDRVVLVTLGVGVLSLVLMVATLLARIDDLAVWFPIHLNAEGAPDQWGTPATLWRIPLIAVMATLMSAVIGWTAGRKDRFAFHFMIASTLLVHALCWVALLNLV